MKPKEHTTIQIYREDLIGLTAQCKRGENLRDKLHEIIKKWKENFPPVYGEEKEE